MNIEKILAILVFLSPIWWILLIYFVIYLRKKYHNMHILGLGARLELNDIEREND